MRCVRWVFTYVRHGMQIFGSNCHFESTVLSKMPGKKAVEEHETTTPRDEAEN